MRFKKEYILQIFIIYYWLFTYYSAYWGSIERFSALYFLMIIPALLFIGIYIQDVFTIKFNKRSTTLLLMGVIVCVLSFVRLDIQTAVSINFILLTIIAILNSRVSISLNFINKLFIFSVLGSIVSFHLGINPYGYIPNFASGELISTGGAAWRISLFPLVADSALFCVIVIIINYFENKNRIIKWIYFCVAGYFLLFSGLRTAFILFSFLLCFALATKVLSFRNRAFYRNFNTMLVAILVFVLSFHSIILYFGKFDNQFVNQLLFKSEGNSDISQEQLYNTISRTWIWEQHLKIFMENPLVGVGSFELHEYINSAELAYQKSTGSESYLTHLFAEIGIVAILFIVFIYRVQQNALRNKNMLSYIMVLYIMITSIFYSSFFVPYNFLFLICIPLFNNQESTGAKSTLHTSL